MTNINNFLINMLAFVNGQNSELRLNSTYQCLRTLILLLVFGNCILIRVMEDLDPILGRLVLRQEYTLDGIQI